MRHRTDIRSEPMRAARAGPGRPGAPLCRGRRAAGRHRARGTVLIVTMWILLVLAGLVLVLARMVRVEGDRAANHVAAVQAVAVEQGAIQYVLASVDGLEGDVPTEADTPCEAIQVGDGLFWILRPASSDESTYPYGITDEASKVDLNTATPDMIARLPGMTTEFAASIVDWRDADSNVTPSGAENEYYLLLADPYECKNSPLETVGELFLVRGVTREIMFGRDTNRNGVVDLGESAASATRSFSSSGSRVDLGIINYVTVFSSAAGGGTSGGAGLVNVNEPLPVALVGLLQSVVSADRLPGVLDRVRRERPFSNAMDFYYRAGLTMDEFQKVANRITTGSGPNQASLINVNTAPKEVLLCLPGLEDGDVSALISKRAGAEVDRTSVAWVADVLPREKAVAVGGYLTAQTSRFSADIVSIPASGRAFKRCWVVIDASASPPKVVYRQNLTHLGWPLSRDIMTRLRAGLPLERTTQTLGRTIG